MSTSTAPRSSLRNRVAWRLANAALLIADPTYRAWISGSLRYGLASAARDAELERVKTGAA